MPRIANCNSGHGFVGALKRDEIWLNYHRALVLCLSMIFSENRFALFRIMLYALIRGASEASPISACNQRAIRRHELFSALQPMKRPR
ncbi:hypothetical protein CI41S_76310 [Bradyrhizobium ivorense]|nr:hypothetical protein CI41S_76310 [Bradyrhizobium ivorense]